MAALAHGWRPDHGDVAKIPVAVAKEFNAEDQKKRRRERLVKALVEKR